MLILSPVSCAVSAAFTAKMTIFGDFGCLMGIQVINAAQMSPQSSLNANRTLLNAYSYNAHFAQGM